MKAVKTTYSYYNKEIVGGEVAGNIWELKEDNNKLVKTVCFTYCEDGSHQVCFVIDEIEEYAVVIDNKDWDLLCFATDYTRESVVQTCRNYINWVKAAPNYVSDQSEIKYADDDELMEVIS